MPAHKGFQLDEVMVKFTHINTRLEKHGEELRSAADLSMSLKTENDILEQILPGMIALFYGKPGKGPGVDLADQGKADALIRLKYPALSHQKIDLELVNYTLAFIIGLDRVVIFEDCTIKKIEVELHDGGTVELHWKVAVYPKDSQACDLQERQRAVNVTISLWKAEPVQKQKSLLDNEPEKNPVEAAGGDEP